MFFFKKHQQPLCLPANFTVTGHTGCMNTPANSLESIDVAADCGVQIVEIDLRYDKNGEPVLSHDEPKGGEVTLDEAFARVSTYKDLLVNVDVKTTAYLEKVVPLAEKHGILERIFFTGLFEKDIGTVKAKSPGVPYYLNYNVEKNKGEEYINSLIRKVKDCGAIGINCRHKAVTKAFVDAFRRNGLLVSVWTVSKPRHMRRALAFAPDNITTREPATLMKVLSE